MSVSCMTLETVPVKKPINLRFCQANKKILIILFQVFLGSSEMILGTNFPSLNQLHTLGKVDLKKIHKLREMPLEF